MRVEDLLIGLSELAIALAGFSGLVVAIRTASRAPWHPRDVWSLSWMLGASIGALFIAMTPVLLFHMGVAEATLWVVTDVVMFLFTATFAVAMLVFSQRLDRRGFPPRVPLFPSVASLLFLLAGLTALLAAIGIIPGLRTGAIVLGLIVSLLIAALTLVVFLVIMAGEAQPPA